MKISTLGEFRQETKDYPDKTKLVLFSYPIHDCRMVSPVECLLSICKSDNKSELLMEPLYENE